MSTADAVLTCRDCGGSFTFSEDECRTFAAVGHHHPPGRCSRCRAARKARQVGSGVAPAAPKFRELRQTETTITCSECGGLAVVPFAAPGRNVYCAACFQRRRLQGDT